MKFHVVLVGFLVFHIINGVVVSWSVLLHVLTLKYWLILSAGFIVLQVIQLDVLFQV